MAFTRGYTLTKSDGTKYTASEARDELDADVVEIAQFNKARMAREFEHFMQRMILNNCDIVQLKSND